MGQNGREPGPPAPPPPLSSASLLTSTSCTVLDRTTPAQGATEPSPGVPFLAGLILCYIHLSMVSKSDFLKKEGLWSVLSVGSSLGGVGMMGPFPGHSEGVWALSEALVGCVGRDPRGSQPTRLLSGRVGRGQGSGCYRDVTSVFFQRGPPGGHTGGPEQGRSCAKGAVPWGGKRAVPFWPKERPELQSWGQPGCDGPAAEASADPTLHGQQARSFKAVECRWPQIAGLAGFGRAGRRAQGKYTR